MTNYTRAAGKEDSNYLGRRSPVERRDVITGDTGIGKRSGGCQRGRRGGGEGVYRREKTKQIGRIYN